MPLITTTEALESACARLAKHPFVTFDTEFMRETTYYPKLCLIQLASPDEVVLVDPLAPELDLSSFLALMRNPAVVKAVHSGRQDLEILWNMDGCIPVPLFDTQVAAMVCGYGDSVSYEQLAHDLAKARIDKSSRFTDWSKRPLSEAQLVYARSDVTHLRDVYLELVKKLEESGRTHWLANEMEVLTSPATYQAHPEDAWQRLRGRVRKAKELGVLIELAAWREREAQSRDVPRSRVLKDDAVMDVVTAAPRTPEALGHLRSIPSGFERSRAGGDIVAAVQRGLDRDPKALPPLERNGRRSFNQATVELLKVLLKMTCEQEGVAAKIVATVDDLEAIASDDAAKVPAMQGWRRELFGERALALKHGRLALAMDDGKVVSVPRHV
ncbi:ribonuclease D [Alsobacter metallidurans]|uniref:Ribonuclease D n=1 Tax=Alsobacter metallidurans TaxID=340221 RepID=A0A917I726_9HYPH|nr:ribonuclease D [Alsobacter metallidurans]GGH21276.1 ribonuclease D [Alsobacter metallidurans]